nr:hypothetical protein OJOKFFHK_00006 [uncultured bacterium]
MDLGLKGKTALVTGSTQVSDLQLQKLCLKKVQAFISRDAQRSV